MENDKIKRVVKNVAWLKSVVGVRDSEIKKYVKAGYPIMYIYEVFCEDGDGIATTCFKNPLSDKSIQKRFGEDAQGDVCEVDLRGLA